LSYGELDLVTNQLAELLKESGCNKGDRIAFCIPKSPVALISMIGTLKADCVYVPIDTDSPAARVLKVVESCRPTWIFATEASQKLVDEVFAVKELTGSIRVGSLQPEHLQGEHFKSEFKLDDLDSFSGDPLSYQNRSDDAAHILFTSGSTGVPKGVVITHSNVITFVEWGVEYFGIDETDRVSGHAPLHFDLSTFDIYGAFAAGAELHPVPVELNLLPHKIAGFIRENELTQWFSVPSILNYMCKFDVVDFGDFASLRRLIWCGEVLPTPTLRYFMTRLPNIEFTNLYGPTEATIASSFYTVPSCPSSDTEDIPIGVACQGEELLVLNDSLECVATDEIGTLYIGGVGLSPGYWRDSEKTNSVFITDPRENGTGRIYNTGDLAKLDSDGLVHFLGRSDTQSKSRGYRIELGEIETALHTISFLEESAVVAIDTDGFENKAICCAYVESAGSNSTVAMIRKELFAVIPKYMVPTRWIQLDALPRNANGKIHRPQLRELFTQELAASSSTKVGAAT
jgi:amino acid adenylation domain-containing protein